MSIEHKSRTGKTYYLRAGQGKNGKPNYFFSIDPEGPVVNSLPEGFEVYENVGGQVFLRRKRPQLFTDEEITLVKKALKAHAEEWLFKVEIKKDALVIHEANDNTGAFERIAQPWICKAIIQEQAITTATYQPVMRFVLTDTKNRLFCAERFCFCGTVDDWIDIDIELRPLPVLLKKFIRHLGKESIFDLY